LTPFLIGIDLGTTNPAMAFVDTPKKQPRAVLFRVPQLVEPSVVEARAVLPSFLYLAEPGEAERGALSLPWDPRPAVIAGVMAREAGALVPSRQISSAKS
jgi:molecular chaperone DnaK (HSP70)